MNVHRVLAKGNLERIDSLVDSSVNAEMMIRRVIHDGVGGVRGHADTMSTAVLRTYTVSTSRSLPARIASASILCHTLAVAVALVITMRLRTVISGPTLVAFTEICTDATTMSRARFSGENGSASTEADGNRTHLASPSLPATANAIQAVPMVGAVVVTVVRLAVSSGPASFTMASHRSYAESVSRALMGARWLVTMLSFEPESAVRAILTGEMAGTLADTRGRHASSVRAAAVPRAMCLGAVLSVKTEVAFTIAVLVALTTVGAISWAALE